MSSTLASETPSSGQTLGRPGPSAAGPPSAVLVNSGPRDRKWVALTFDADMTPFMLSELRSGRVRSWYDESITRELTATGTPATIFLTGLWSETYPDVVRSLSRDPAFELENHSFDHAGFEPPCYGLAIVKSKRDKAAEIQRTARIIGGLTGRSPVYFRFPGGCQGQADLELAASLGEQPIGWDVVSGDAFQPDPVVIVRAVLNGVQPGSIVVMHIMGGPNAPATGRALQMIIPALTARGFTFVTVARLLGSG